MFRKEIRKKIKEQKWLALEREDSNPTQMWHRIQRQCVSAIDDLILVAAKLPEDKLKEIFSPDRVDQLVGRILDSGQANSYNNGLNPRKAELAAMLVKKGIDINSSQYLQLNEDTPLLIKPTIDHLKQTVSICNDISYKLKLQYIEKEAEIMKSRYLFSWNNMLGREKRRLLKFITDRTGDDQIEIFQGSIKQSDKGIGFSFGQTIDAEEMVFGTFGIEIYNSNTSAKVMIFHEEWGIRNGGMWDVDLLVRETLGDGDFNIYMKKDDRTKK